MNSSDDDIPVEIELDENVGAETWENQGLPMGKEFTDAEKKKNRKTHIANYPHKSHTIRKMITKMDANPRKYKQFRSKDEKRLVRGLTGFMSKEKVGENKETTTILENLEEEEPNLGNIFIAQILKKMHEHHILEKFEKEERSKAISRKRTDYGSLMERMLEANLESMDTEDKYDAAGRIFRDAVFSRRTRFHFGNSFIRFIYNWHCHPGWEAFMVFLSWSYLILSFWENTYSGGQDYKPWNTQFYVTIFLELFIQICLLTYNINDTILRATDKDRNKFQSFVNFKVLSRLIIDSLLMIDYILFFSLYANGIAFFRFGRLLRPVKVFIYSKPMRRNLNSILNCWYHILDVIILYCITIFLFALLGIKLFSGDVDQSQLTDDNDMTSFISASRQLYILTTFANYPNVIDPYMKISQYYFFYFLPFILLVLMFFIPIPVATIADRYGQNLAELLRYDRMREKEAFFAVHCCLDTRGKMAINLHEWRILCSKIYNNKQHTEKIDEIFEFYDADQNERLDIYEFFEACELMVCLESVGKAYIPELACWNSLREFFNDKLKFKIWVRSVYFEIFVFLVIMLNVVVLILEATTTNEKTRDICLKIDTYLLFFYIAEIILKIISYGITDYFEDPWNKFDFTLVVLSLIIASTISFMKMVRYIKGTKMFKTAGKGKALRGVKSCRVLTVMASPFGRIKNMIIIVSINMPTLLNILNILFLLFYTYTIYGIEFFHPKNKELKRTDYEASIVGDFSEFSMGIVILFQVLAQGSWHSLIYHYRETHTAAFWYFTSFQFLSVIVLLSLTCGIIWSVFNITQAEKLELDDYEDKEDENLQPEAENASRKGDNDDIITNPTITQLLPDKTSKSAEELGNKLESSEHLLSQNSAPNMEPHEKLDEILAPKPKVQKKESGHSKGKNRPDNVGVTHKYYWREALLADAQKESAKREEEERIRGEFKIQGKVGKRLKLGVNVEQVFDELFLHFIKSLRDSQNLQEFQNMLCDILKRIHESTPKGALFYLLQERGESEYPSRLYSTQRKEEKRGINNFQEISGLWEDIEANMPEEEDEFTIKDYLKEGKWLNTSADDPENQRKGEIFDVLSTLGGDVGSKIGEVNKSEYVWNCLVTPVLCPKGMEIGNIHDISEQERISTENVHILTRVSDSHEPQLSRKSYLRGFYLLCFLPNNGEPFKTVRSEGDVRTNSSPQVEEFGSKIVFQLFEEMKIAILTNYKKLMRFFN